MTSFDEFMNDYMDNNDTDFDKWSEDFSKSMDAISTKKEQSKVINNFQYRGSVDSNSMLNDLDKYMNPSIPQFSNVWEYLESVGISREVIEHMDLSFDNINCVIEKLTVDLVGGNQVGFENIKLEA